MNLADHIEANKLSRADICAATGISRAMLSLIESGKRRIGVDKAESFAAALGLPVHKVRPDLALMFAPSGETQPGEELPSNTNSESSHAHTHKTTPDAA